MLTFEMLDDKILYVKQVLWGWSSTSTQHWYYDTQRWLRNCNGRLDERPTSPMDQASIDFVKRQYLPKVGIAAAPPEQTVDGGASARTSPAKRRTPPPNGMLREEDIVFESACGTYWAMPARYGFDIYKTGLTHSTRVAQIGFQGERGMEQVKAEVERRLALDAAQEPRGRPRVRP